MRTALLFLTLSLATVACRKSVTITSSTATTAPDTLVAGTVIRSAGTWSAHGAKDTHRLEVTVSGNSVSWQVIREEKLSGGRTSAGSSSSGMTISSPSDSWFIFVESPRRLWFFDGKSDLTYAHSDRGGSRSGPAIGGGKLDPTDEKIPMDLVPHLPPDLQKLFPPVEPKSERPSF